jgi:death-on-curing protein
MTIENNFLSISDVLEIHKLLIQKSNFLGESDHVLNMGLLESAISQPMQTFAGEFLNPTVYEQAASYLYSLANNHAFENGNKRTALAVTISFLRINGYRITLPKNEVETLVLDAVVGNITKDQIAKIFKEGGIEPT